MNSSEGRRHECSGAIWGLHAVLSMEHGAWNMEAEWTELN
jgi:hypothetical protein